MIAFILAAAVAVLTILLGIFAPHIAAATGIPITIVRAVVYPLGLAAIAAILVLRKKIDEAVPLGKGGTAAKSPNAGALDDLLREAESKLAGSARSGAKSLRTLPMLYVLGDASSAKTTAVLKSGLEPELLAGQIYREQDVVPTAVANIWYTQKAAIVEAGNLLRSDGALWSRLLARTRPAAAKSAFAGGAPFRAAIVCVSCDQFLGTTSTEAVQAAAAGTGERLRQLATALGTQVPVYVLFTKLDRVPGFTEYVRNLSFDEASELIGAAPGAVSTTSGYLENATSAALAAYDGLVFSLGGARLDLLAREADQARLSPAYEFPRELRKLRNYLAAYLVELVRPSHLNSNPYLRGFYFTGVRAFLRQQAVSSPVQAPAATYQDPGATSVFAFKPPVSTPVQPTFSTASEKVAQWAFLPRFFPETVLGDTSALADTAQTNHATLFRRIVYASCAALMLLYLILLTVSYFNNAALERQIESASAALAASPSSAAALASTEQLTLLDGLRLHLVQLEDFHRDGAPLAYRWGLYGGDRLLAPARRLYFAHFRTLLLDRTQTNMLATLQTLPSAPPPGAEYNGTYAALRGYLITTANPDKSRPTF